MDNNPPNSSNLSSTSGAANDVGPRGRRLKRKMSETTGEEEGPAPYDPNTPYVASRIERADLYQMFFDANHCPPGGAMIPNDDPDSCDSDEINAFGQPKQNITIHIPSKIRALLVEDLIHVQEEKTLYKIPARVSVETILKLYDDSKAKRFMNPSEQLPPNVVPITVLLRKYFNNLLPLELLYDAERAQVHYVMQNAFKGVATSKLYGGYHLMRLMVKLKEILPYEPMINDQTLHYYEDGINHFLGYMTTHLDLLLLQ